MRQCITQPLQCKLRGVSLFNYHRGNCENRRNWVNHECSKDKGPKGQNCDEYPFASSVEGQNNVAVTSECLFIGLTELPL